MVDGDVGKSRIRVLVDKLQRLPVVLVMLAVGVMLMRLAKVRLMKKTMTMLLMRLAKVRLMKKTMTMLLMRLVKVGLMKTTNRL